MYKFPPKFLKVAATPGPALAVSPPVTAPLHVSAVPAGAGELGTGAGAQAQAGLVLRLGAAGLGVVVDCPLMRSQQ